MKSMTSTLILLTFSCMPNALIASNGFLQSTRWSDCDLDSGQQTKYTACKETQVKFGQYDCSLGKDFQHKPCDGTPGRPSIETTEGTSAPLVKYVEIGDNLTLSCKPADETLDDWHFEWYRLTGLSQDDPWEQAPSGIENAFDNDGRAGREELSIEGVTSDATGVYRCRVGSITELGILWSDNATMALVVRGGADQGDTNSQVEELQRKIRNILGVTLTFIVLLVAIIIALLWYIRRLRERWTQGQAQSNIALRTNLMTKKEGQTSHHESRDQTGNAAMVYSLAGQTGQSSRPENEAGESVYSLAEGGAAGNEYDYAVPDRNKHGGGRGSEPVMQGADRKPLPAPRQPKQASDHTDSAGDYSQPYARALGANSPDDNMAAYGCQGPPPGNDMDAGEYNRLQLPRLTDPASMRSMNSPAP